MSATGFAAPTLSIDLTTPYRRIPTLETTTLESHLLSGSTLLREHPAAMARFEVTQATVYS